MYKVRKEKVMINILAIGNSFSQDATHYLHQIAGADGVETKVVNLYIGGCSLERHWANVQSGAKDYLSGERRGVMARGLDGI